MIFTNSRTGGWLVNRKPVVRPRFSLVCFPYAGAGASAYATWQRRLPLSVQLLSVQLPGRESRIDEDPLRRVNEIVDNVAPLIAEEASRSQVVLFGHSLGALLAFEVCRSLRRDGFGLPSTLVVSGRRAPDVPSRLPPIHGLPPDQLVDTIARFDGTPPELFSDPDLVSLFLPALRADFEVAETYVHEPGDGPLPVDILALSANDDEMCTREEVLAWSRHTTVRFEHVSFPGGHFFVRDSEEAVVRSVLARV